MKIPIKTKHVVPILLWGAVVIAAILVTIFALLPAPPPVDAHDTAEPDLVRIISVTPRDLVQSIALPGQVIPNRSIMLAAELGGVITQLAVQKGDTVKAGDILARIDQRNWEANHRQAEIEARDAARDLARWQSMREEGAVSQSEFDAVQRRQELTAIARELAQIQLDKSIVRAPADGQIEDHLLEAGAFINEGQTLFHFMTPTPMKVTFHVPERDIAMLQPEQILTLRAPALPDNPTFQGRVTYLGNQATPPTFSYPAELIIRNPPTSLRPGMIIDVEIERAVLNDALAIPLTAVIPRRGEHIVFLHRDGVAQRTVVWLGTMHKDEVVITSGLQPDDQVIIAGHRTLQDGAPVEIESNQE